MDLGSGGGQAIQLEVSGGIATLTLGGGGEDAAGAENTSGAQTGAVAGNSAILLLTTGADGGVAVAGIISVVQQGNTLKAAPSSAEVSSIPQIDRAGIRTVTIDYTLPTGNVESVSVSISTQGVLLISVPNAMRETLDERHIILIGIAIAKQRLAVSVENIKGVLLEVN